MVQRDARAGVNMKIAFPRDAGPMNIGRAAAAAGMSARMVRYYEGVGLVPRAGRSAAGYRRYGPEEVQRLRFIKRSRELGFSVERIGELLALWQDGNRASADVKRLALAHVAELNGRIRELEAMRDQCSGWPSAATATPRPIARSSRRSPMSAVHPEPGPLPRVVARTAPWGPPDGMHLGQLAPE